LEFAATNGKLRRPTCPGLGLPSGANRSIYGSKPFRLREALENLLEARKVHSRQDYARMAEPILLEVQQREQEILEYLSRDLGQPIAS
jgi:hypothetical protein